MQKFELTMMCTSCKWKISEELKNKGYQNFDIDMTTSILTFHENVSPQIIVSIVNNIGYKIEPIDSMDDMSDEELAILEDALRNGYSLDE